MCIYTQVVAGLRYDLVIEVALSITCTRESDLCTSVECPIDEHSQSKWMVSVVAPPSPSNEMIVYDVISVAPVNSVEETVRIVSQLMPTILYLFAGWSCYEYTTSAVYFCYASNWFVQLCSLKDADIKM